ncbi:MAG: cation:proton antiporter [Chloroflexi bacterium]|nr:cation:proton antiporter [Chloroflexota bacterium]
MNTTTLITVFVLMLGAALAPIVSAWLSIPAAVGELTFGAVVGLFLPQALRTAPIITFLGDFGFLLLMFLAGLEVDVRSVARDGWRGFVTRAPFGILVPFLGIGSAWLLHLPLLLGLVAGCVSLGVVLPVLKELQLSRTGLGQHVLIVGAVGELNTVLLLAVLGQGSQAQPGTPVFVATMISLAKLLALFLAAGALLTALRELLWWFPRALRVWAFAEDRTELGIRAAVAIVVLFATLAHVLGVPDVLATFLAGLAIAAVFPGREPLLEKLGTTGFGFFIPIFFINVGWSINWSELLRPQSLGLIGALLAATFLLRVIAFPALLLRLRGREAVAATFLLAAPVTLQVAVVAYGVAVKALPSSLLPVVVIASGLGAIIAPSIFRRLFQRLDEPAKGTSQ